MFKAHPHSIIFELTNRCNCKCIMCDIWMEAPKRDFDIVLFEKILRNLRRVKNIAITGGEPFMISNLIQYYRLIRKYIPKANVNISTNGYFTKEIISFLDTIDCKRVSITISYDGVRSHDVIRDRPGSAKRLINTASIIKTRFSDVNLSFKFTVVPENYSEILETANHSKQLGMPFRIKLAEQLRCGHSRIDKPPIKFNEKQMTSIREQALMILNNGTITNKKFIRNLMKKDSMTCTWSNRILFLGLDGKAFQCRKKEHIGDLNCECISDILQSQKRKHILKQMKKCDDFKCLCYCNN